jgi:hypothetical protein
MMVRGSDQMKNTKEPFTEDKILQMFRDLNIETEPKREVLLRLSSNPSEGSETNEQVFIRIFSKTDFVEEDNNA